MKFENSVTLNNLCASFTGECQEGARYQFMAKMAMQQQLTSLQTVLKDLAKNEMAHAEQFFNLIKSKTNPAFVSNLRISATYNYSGGELEQMLDDTVKIEQHQQKVVYKNFEKVAADEGFADIAALFKMIADIEGDHANLALQLALQLKENKLYSAADKTAWKCSECGLEHTDTAAPKKCPLCQMPQGTFHLKTDLARYYRR